MISSSFGAQVPNLDFVFFAVFGPNKAPLDKTQMKILIKVIFDPTLKTVPDFSR